MPSNFENEKRPQCRARVTCFSGSFFVEKSGCVNTSVLLVIVLWTKLASLYRRTGFGGDPPHNNVQNNCRLAIVTLA